MTDGIDDDNPGKLTAEQQALAAANVPLCRWAMQRWPGLAEAVGRDEAEALAYLALCRAALHFRPERGRFSTFAVACVLRAWIKAARRRRHEHAGLDAASDVPAPEPGEPIYGGDELEMLRDAAAAVLPPPLRQWYDLCILQGLTREDAARQLGVNRNTLGSRRERAVGMLREALARPRGKRLREGG